jgi:hypothetical protein
MPHISLDRENDSVKQFVRSLPLKSEGIDLELEGRVICKVVPPFEEAEKSLLIERGRALVEAARRRNRGTPARVIEREVRDALGEVRRRKTR